MTSDTPTPAESEPQQEQKETKDTQPLSPPPSRTPKLARDPHPQPSADPHTKMQHAIDVDTLEEDPPDLDEPDQDPDQLLSDDTLSPPPPSATIDLTHSVDNSPMPLHRQRTRISPAELPEQSQSTVSDPLDGQAGTVRDSAEEEVEEEVVVVDDDTMQEAPTRDAHGPDDEHTEEDAVDASADESPPSENAGSADGMEDDADDRDGSDGVAEASAEADGDAEHAMEGEGDDSLENGADDTGETKIATGTDLLDDMADEAGTSLPGEVDAEGVATAKEAGTGDVAAKNDTVAEQTVEAGNAGREQIFAGSDAVAEQGADASPAAEIVGTNKPPKPVEAQPEAVESATIDAPTQTIEKQPIAADAIGKDAPTQPADEEPAVAEVANADVQVEPTVEGEDHAQVDADHTVATDAVATTADPFPVTEETDAFTAPSEVLADSAQVKMDAEGEGEGSPAEETDEVLEDVAGMDEHEPMDGEMADEEEHHLDGAGDPDGASTGKAAVVTGDISPVEKEGDARNAEKSEEIVPVAEAGDKSEGTGDVDMKETETPKLGNEEVDAQPLQKAQDGSDDIEVQKPASVADDKVEADGMVVDTKSNAIEGEKAIVVNVAGKALSKTEEKPSSATPEKIIESASKGDERGAAEATEEVAAAPSAGKPDSKAISQVEQGELADQSAKDGQPTSNDTPKVEADAEEKAATTKPGSGASPAPSSATAQKSSFGFTPTTPTAPTFGTGPVSFSSPPSFSQSRLNPAATPFVPSPFGTTSPFGSTAPFGTTGPFGGTSTFGSASPFGAIAKKVEAVKPLTEEETAVTEKKEDLTTANPPSSVTTTKPPFSKTPATVSKGLPSEVVKAESSQPSLLKDEKDAQSKNDDNQVGSQPVLQTQPSQPQATETEGPKTPETTKAAVSGKRQPTRQTLQRNIVDGAITYSVDNVMVMMKKGLDKPSRRPNPQTVVLRTNATGTSLLEICEGQGASKEAWATISSAKDNVRIKKIINRPYVMSVTILGPSGSDKGADTVKYFLHLQKQTFQVLMDVSTKYLVENLAQKGRPKVVTFQTPSKQRQNTAIGKASPTKEQHALASPSRKQELKGTPKIASGDHQKLLFEKMEALRRKKAGKAPDGPMKRTAVIADPGKPEVSTPTESAIRPTAVQTEKKEKPKVGGTAAMLRAGTVVKPKLLLKPTTRPMPSSPKKRPAFRVDEEQANAAKKARLTAPKKRQLQGLGDRLRGVGSAPGNVVTTPKPVEKVPLPTERKPPSSSIADVQPESSRKRKLGVVKDDAVQKKVAFSVPDKIDKPVVSGTSMPEEEKAKLEADSKRLADVLSSVEKLTSLEAVESASLPSSLQRCDPSSVSDFFDRLHTFRPSTWPGFSEGHALSPVECARTGWYNSGVNRLKSSEGAEIVNNILRCQNVQAILDEEDRVRGLILGKGHKLLSGWIGKSCPEEFGTVQGSKRMHSGKDLAKNAEEIRKSKVLDALLKNGCTLQSGLQVRGQDHAATLAAYNWSARIGDDGEVDLHCNWCNECVPVEAGFGLDEAEEMGKVEFDVKTGHYAFCPFQRTEEGVRVNFGAMGVTIEKTDEDATMTDIGTV